MQVRDAEEFCVPQDILGDGPERLHARPWPTDYVEAFQSLRIATDRVKKARSDLDELMNEWGRYRDFLAAAERRSDRRCTHDGRS